jgi:membrane protease subunit (stomatin/prohibitin family)
MAIFKKNPNESAYVGGQKHWVDVIKNTCPGDQLIYRQPEEDFNTNSTLIVMPGEAAIFVKGGVIEQVFESGTYRLSTENYPFISRF